MTDTAPAARHARLTLDQIATAAAGIVAEARAAGLVMPFSLHAHDYGPPHATLYIAERQDRDIWEALQEWAWHYGSEVAAGPGITPDTVYAVVEFRRDGIKYEISAVIHDSDADNQPAPLAAA